MNVSIITPTSERPEHLRLLYKVIQSQKFEGKWQWLILDDSYKKDPFFQNLPNVEYIYSENPLNVGQKRDILTKKASYDVIAHFDDDDYYSPHYLQNALTHLTTADFFSLSAWFCYSSVNKQFFYWATEDSMDYCFALNHVGELLMFERSISQMAHTKGFGFSYVYKKVICEKINFNPLKIAEDLDFFERAEREGFKMKQSADQEGLCLKVHHDTNLSRIFPQYRLPPFLGEKIFQKAKSFLKKYPQ